MLLGLVPSHAPQETIPSPYDVVAACQDMLKQTVSASAQTGFCVWPSRGHCVHLLHTCQWAGRLRASSTLMPAWSGAVTWQAQLGTSDLHRKPAPAEPVAAPKWCPFQPSTLTPGVCREGRYNLADTRFFSTPPVHGALCKFIDHPAGALLGAVHLSPLRYHVALLGCPAGVLMCKF